MNRSLGLIHLFIAVASASSACGCGSDDGEGTAGSGGSSGATSGGGDDTCLLQVVLSGAVAEDISWDSKMGCGGGSTPEAMTVGFGGLTNPLNVKLTVFGITEGQPGAGTSAQVRVTQDDLVWTTAEDGCQAEVTTFELKEENNVGKNYRVAGTGSCTGAADITEGGATGAVTIGDFDFVSVTLY
jgi:hypothetical protein